MADEVQTFKALITIHKVLQEGHPITVKEAQQNVNWVESLARGVNGEGLRGMSFSQEERNEVTEAVGLGSGDGETTRKAGPCADEYFQQATDHSFASMYTSPWRN